MQQGGLGFLCHHECQGAGPETAEGVALSEASEWDAREGNEREE